MFSIQTIFSSSPPQFRHKNATKHVHKFIFFQSSLNHSVLPQIFVVYNFHINFFFHFKGFKKNEKKYQISWTIFFLLNEKDRHTFFCRTTDFFVFVSPMHRWIIQKSFWEMKYSFFCLVREKWIFISLRTILMVDFCWWSFEYIGTF